MVSDKGRITFCYTHSMENKIWYCIRNYVKMKFSLNGSKEAKWTPSVCSVRTVLFEVSCKSIFRKSLLLIEIKNYLGGVCSTQYKVHNICQFYLITEAATKGLFCKIRVLTILATFLKKFVAYRPRLFFKRIPSRTFLGNFAKILVTLSDIGRTPIQLNCSQWL